MCVLSQDVVRLSSTRRLKPPKVTAFAKLAIGTAIQPSRERLRTVVDGCRWLRNIWRSQLQPPDPQSETGTLATLREKWIFKWCHRSWPEQNIYWINVIWWHFVFGSPDPWQRQNYKKHIFSLCLLTDLVIPDVPKGDRPETIPKNWSTCCWKISCCFGITRTLYLMISIQHWLVSFCYFTIRLVFARRFRFRSWGPWIMAEVPCENIKIVAVLMFVFISSQPWDFEGFQIRRQPHLSNFPCQSIPGFENIFLLVGMTTSNILRISKYTTANMSYLHQPISEPWQLTMIWDKQLLTSSFLWFKCQPVWGWFCPPHPWVWLPDLAPGAGIWVSWDGMIRTMGISPIFAAQPIHHFLHFSSDQFTHLPNKFPYGCHNIIWSGYRHSNGLNKKHPIRRPDSNHTGESCSVHMILWKILIFGPNNHQTDSNPKLQVNHPTILVRYVRLSKSVAVLFIWVRVKMGYTLERWMVV